MPILSVADCGRLLAIDPKTWRRWTRQAQFMWQSHPHDARLKGLTGDQLRLLASTHHRSLAALPQEAPVPAPATPAEPATLPADLRELLRALSALPAQLAAVQEHLADLSHCLLQPAGPSATPHSRSGATTRAAGRHQSRGRAESLRKPQRPSKAQVLALVAYAGEGHSVVISPRGGPAAR